MRRTIGGDIIKATKRNLVKKALDFGSQRFELIRLDAKLLISSPAFWGELNSEKFQSCALTANHGSYCVCLDLTEFRQIVNCKFAKREHRCEYFISFQHKT